MNAIFARSDFDPAHERKKGFSLVIRVMEDCIEIYPLTFAARSRLQDESFWSYVQLFPQTKFRLNAGLEECLDVVFRLFPGIKVFDLFATECMPGAQENFLCFGCRPDCRSCDPEPIFLAEGI